MTRPYHRRMRQHVLSCLCLTTLLTACGQGRVLVPPARPATSQTGIWRAQEEPLAAGRRLPELRLPLTEAGFRRLQSALPWRAETSRLDYSYDCWDGERFRRMQQPEAPRLRLKLKGEKTEWQVSRGVERVTIAPVGLPVTLSIVETWEGRLADDAAGALRLATQAFFLRLDLGGPPLLASARDVDRQWRALPAWAGQQPFGGPAQAALFPSAMKRRNGWTVTLPREEVGGGLKLGLHFDESRDDAGRWRERFEIEAEPEERSSREQLVAAAADFGKLLAASGLTTDEVGGETPDATLFTAQQLRQSDALNPFLPAHLGLQGSTGTARGTYQPASRKMLSASMM
ncbi:MAG: hypothetical protein VKP62_09515 [Candidatus Sericytochromatia bacterium]|nr:hypothetical protein [Candidatus Sericytochromatia bacterium]